MKQSGKAGKHDLPGKPQNQGGLRFDSITLTRGHFTLNVDTTIPEGLLTVILGPSGCGKTTLLDVAAGFIRPQKGRIIENGINVTDLPPQKRRAGVVFQDPALFPHLTVLKNITFGPRSRGIPRKIAEKKSRELLKLVDLDQYENRKPQTLSGGERQRVALARALAIDPDVLLLDEPFSALDASLRRSLRNQVRSIQRRLGITMILVSHDQDEAMNMADHIALMNKGKVVDAGTPGNLWKNPGTLFTARFLGHSTRLKVRQTRIKGKHREIVTSAGTLNLNNETTDTAASTLVLRPEWIRMEPGGQLTGIVRSVDYCGGYYRILSVPIDADADDQIIAEITDPPPEPGSTLSFSANPEGACLVHD